MRYAIPAAAFGFMAGLVVLCGIEIRHENHRQDRWNYVSGCRAAGKSYDDCAQMVVAWQALR